MQRSTEFGPGVTLSAILQSKITPVDGITSHDGLILMCYLTNLNKILVALFNYPPYDLQQH